MNRNQIKQLIEKSYIHDNLDEKTIEKISGLLKRSELKLYIKALKDAEKRKSVLVFVSSIPSTKLKKDIAILYPKKKISYVVDPTLLVGIKILDYDVVTEYNLKNNLENLLSYIGQNNDK